MSCEVLPPGFRFHPTDEELIVHYLQNHATSRPCPVPIIPEVDIYKFDPWELPGESDMCDGEWYFFSLRNRKYPNGTRPNRSTKSGYWKATGNDKLIYSRARSVGTKKALVFYKGRPPRGSKTDWVMHEYRLPSATGSAMRLDDWVLCRIYDKGKKKSTSTSTSTTATSSSTTNTEQDKSGKEYITSIAHLLESHDYISISQLFDDSVPFYSVDDLFEICTTDSSGTGESSANFYSADATVAVENQAAVVDPIFRRH